MYHLRTAQLALVAALLTAAIPTVSVAASTDAEPTNAELLRRLEATEAELAELRIRLSSDVSPVPLPAVEDTWTEPDFELEYSSPVLQTSGQSLDCPRPAALCNECKSKLAWSKGSWTITPFGFLTGEAIGTTSATVSRPLILYVAEDLGGSDQIYTVTGQTSALGLNFSGPRVGDFQSGGQIFFNFLGDRPALNQATPFFLRGYGELKNKNWRFTFGQQGDLFNPLDPVTVNFGGHKQAGNGGAFRASLRAERYLRPSDSVQWTIQTALSQQVVTDFVTNPLVLGEDNGWPNVEGRIGLGLGRTRGTARPLEVGLSGVIGETRAFGPLGTGVFTTWGVSPDFQWNAENFGFRGEAFVGQAIGTYNMGIGQSLEANGFNAIQTVGGWGELWLRLTSRLTLRGGYGIDDPRNEDLGQFLDPGTLTPLIGQRSRNSVAWISLFYDVTDAFQFAFEVSHRETDYIAPSISNDAQVFHFRSRLAF